MRGRGLLIDDELAAYQALTRIGYYRLCGYMLPFQRGTLPNKHDFRPGSSLSQVLELYRFDTAIRAHLMGALDRIEVAFRVALCDRLAFLHGAHWHCEPALFEAAEWPSIRQKVCEALLFDDALGQPMTRRSGTHLFIDHYYKQYSTPTLPPAWMLLEVSTFGLAARLFKQLRSPADRAAVASSFSFPDRKPIDESVLTGWIHSLSVLRNRCAHHERIVHRQFPFEPKASSNKSVSKLLTGRDAKSLSMLMCVVSILDRSIAQGDWTGELRGILEAFEATVDCSHAIGLGRPWRDDHLFSVA